MRKVKTHKFNGHKYEILIGEFDGFADDRENNRALVLSCDLNTQNGLITAIHEALHCIDWDMRENKVEKTSVDIGRFLWRLGYRTKWKSE